MNKTILMQEVNSCECLYEEIEGKLFFVRIFLFLDHDKKIALINVLHDKVDILFIFQISEHSDNILMLQFLMNLNLSP